MKPITSIKKAFKAIKKHGLLETDLKGIHYNIDDFHKTPVQKKIIIRLMDEGILQKAPLGSWFQNGYRVISQHMMTDQQISKYVNP